MVSIMATENNLKGMKDFFFSNRHDCKNEVEESFMINN